ncbi:hypothetical protein AB1Y20_019312 [Prymnesium parvum]|uniref:UBA domain-containing protein n=1 Tax=Prymnesium parvum TaxID=97485 RepID=A0AB34JUA4_PRYPA
MGDPYPGAADPYPVPSRENMITMVMQFTGVMDEGIVRRVLQDHHWDSNMASQFLLASGGLEVMEFTLPAGASPGRTSTDRTILLAQEMANAALVAMRDPRRAICDLLTSQDGKFAVGKDASRTNFTKGTHHTNDRVESNFGCIDLLTRMFRYATVESISGMAQQMRNRDFDTPPTIVSDRRKGKRKHEQKENAGGFFYTGLSEKLRESLVAYARKAAADARVDGRLAVAAQAEEKLARREERVITLLNTAVERYAYAKELFQSWMTQRAESKEIVAKALLNEHGKAKPEAQQLEYLRIQIEMRVLGCGWTEYATRWSSSKDSRIGTVAHLQTLLEEIIIHEKSLRG